HAPAHVKAVIEACRLRAVQLHGDEKPEDWADLAVPIIKTVKLAPATTIAGLPEYKLGERMNALWWRKVASAILFDSDARWSEDGDTREPIEWRSIRMMGATAPNEGRVHLVLSGGPTPLYFAARLTEHCGGARIWLKREDLCHTGAHKINNVLGQALLAARMKKTRIIAETGAGQHGVATATAAALLGVPCEVYMGAEDIARQALNVFRMRLLGAKVIPVESGSKTLKDAVNEALRDWVT